jgi:ATP-dependent helicase/nuclease subunit A
MGTNKWTDEQLEAITARDENLLVAAAAGAGKTAVLVERIIRRVMDEANPVDIDRLLVVTFTNAAATEMRERIGDAISKALEASPDSRQLQRQLVLLGKSSITTIHSFCLDVIRNNFQYIDLDPGFRIADETEALLLKMEALDELFEEQYADGAGNSEFLELLECYGGNRDDLAIQEMVLALYNFVQSDPWPQKWLESRAEYFNLAAGCDFAATEWGKILLSNTAVELAGLSKMIARALAAAEEADGLEPYIPALREDLSALEEAAAACSNALRSRQGQENGAGCGTWDRITGLLSSMEFSRFARCGKDVDKQKQEYVKSIREDVKKKLKSLKEDIFYASSVQIAEDLQSIYPLIKCLCRLVSDFSERYLAKKRRKQLLDFNDLEHLCLQILTGGSEDGIKASSVADGYRSRYEEILVDEYQDSNLVQEIIIRSISREEEGKPNVFLVGDVKQSIYRFRQAKPELFLDKYNRYSSEKGSGYRKIKLFKNFRSRREVIDASNYIFKQIMSVAAGELDYTDEEALNPGAVFEAPADPKQIAGGSVELHIIESAGRQSAVAESDEEDHDENQETGTSDEDKPLQGQDVTEEEQPGVIQCEAGVIVKRINELMQSDADGRSFMVWDKSSGEYRPLQYRDIVILLRSTKNWAGVILEELAAQGIPAYADIGAGFFKTVEVQIMLSLLQIIDNPRQDIALLSVLRSPIAAFSQDELADLRMADRTACIYDALRTLAAQQDAVSAKAAVFLENLERWRDAALYKSTDELIWYLYSDTGFFSYTGAMPGGVQRQANLRLLFERARQFEETSYKGLFNFIRFIDKLKSGKGDMGSAKILGENENVVRIMSIHKSKGLEFPVVILAGCGKGFNLQDMNRSMLFHQELGFGPDIVDYRKRLSRVSAAKQALRCRIRTESLSEEMRILYVAFTRAREKLIITGTVNSLGKAVSRWGQCAAAPERKLPGFDMLRSRCYLDWIVPALLRHRGCDGIRELSGTVKIGALLDDASLWDYRLWSGDTAAAQKNNDVQANDFLLKVSQLDSDKAYSDRWEEIAHRLDWEYPYYKLSEVPAKLSVTELKRRYASEFSEEHAAALDMPAAVKRPSFLEETRGVSGAEAGTALHFVMQHVRLTDPVSKEDVLKQIAEMVEFGMLTQRQAESVDTGKIIRFFASSLGRRMLASSKVSRELPFNLEVSGSEIVKGFSGEDTVLLQGVIDCFFEETDGIVLIDYKTDYAPEERMDELREKYRLQIGYYARALEQLTGKKVKESYVYLFWSGKTISY